MGKAFVYELVSEIPEIAKLQAFVGKFFIEPINQSTQVCTLSESSQFKVDLICFFMGAHSNANAKKILICHARSEADVSQADVEAHLSKIKGIERFELLAKVFGATGVLSTHLAVASKFLRGSNTLGESEFKKVSDIHVAADAHGVAIVGALYGASRFERACQSVALCCAYRSVLSDLILSLSQVSLGKDEGAEKKLSDWAHFKLAYYFSLPIRQNTIELCEIYNAVNARQKLDVLAAEATEQLQLLAKLRRLERTEKQSQQDKKLQTLLTVLGLLVAFLGCLQIVQVTPKSLQEFVRAWSPSSSL